MCMCAIVFFSEHLALASGTVRTITRNEKTTHETHVAHYKIEKNS